MIDNIKKFEAFLFKNYPDLYKEVKSKIFYSPSNIYKDTMDVANPYSDDEKKFIEFENIIKEYGYTPSIRMI